jgi:tetratricopeptide (TPR) repeat protein
MSNKYSFLRTKISFIIIGLVIGLFTGFKIANSQYRREQGKALNAGLARNPENKAGQGAGHANEEVQAIMEKARANPNDPEAQMDAASQFIQIDRPQEAMPFLEAADKAKPNDPRINAGIGVAQFMLGNLDKAAAHLKRSRDLGATEPSVTSLLIGAYIETGKNLDEAERLLKELESKGVEPARLAQIRADLQAARAGKKPPSVSGLGADPNAKTGGNSKSMLSHGPENNGGKN